MIGQESLRPLRPSKELSSSSSRISPDESNSRRKNVRTACTTCKRRKLKCSGQTPCANCLKTGGTCHINEDGDQRRKHVLKRKIDSLEEKGLLLDRLIATFQESDRMYAAQITNLIRSHASLEEIRAYIDDLIERPRLAKTPELIEACHGVQQWHESQKRVMRSRPEPKELSDMVQFQVPAYPWTSTTDDDDFVSHLISLWFTWVHPFLNWIDKDLFIREMQTGSLDSEFCSPLLVNIILADACAYSDSPEAYAVAAETWARGLHFHREAIRHLENDIDKRKIANIQGMGVLYVCTCMIGRDRIGWGYLNDLAHEVHQLAEKRRPTPDVSDQETLQKLKAIDHTIWGLFMLAAMTALSYQRTTLIKAPQIPYPPLDGEVHRETWSNYPLQSEKTKAHTQCLFKALNGVSFITHDLTWSLFNRDKEERTLNTDSVQATEYAYYRLRTWYDELPNCLGTSNATPHVLSLHLKYHTIIQTTFGALKDLPKAEECDMSAESLRETRQKAQERCIQSAIACGDLIDMHYDLWGLDRMPPVNIQWVTVSMFTLLPHLEDDEKNRKAFTSLSIAAKASSNRWSLGKGMLRLFQVTSKQMEIKLPPETDALFTDFTTTWSREDRKILNSQYPNFINSMKGGQVDEIELDMFLNKFDELHIEDAEDSEGSIEVTVEL